MKKNLLSIICFLTCVLSTQAQTLYGVAANGGDYGGVAAAVSSIYYYRLKSVDKDGNFKYSGIVKFDTVNTNTTQLNISPNPFSNSTTVSFQLSQTQKVMPAGRQVSLSIYDMTGSLIKILANEEMQAGTHQLVWNGRDEKGNVVNAGGLFIKNEGRKLC